MKEFTQYNLVMFPYPSGSGLHVGHYYNYAIIDSYSRWQEYKGEIVFQPFGYDAFGLPAENYAKKIGGDPRDITYKNIETFRAQMDRMNTIYNEKLVTSDPSYIKWTQWLFTKLHEKGLAYKKEAPVNHCSSCETVLANEQVKDDKCERCGTKVEAKVLNQWFFKITDYKERLIRNLDHIDYPKSTIKQQRNWLEGLQDWCVSRQRNWGCPIPIEGETDTLDTFVDSSFYFHRYCTDSNEKFCPTVNRKQVDLYIGGNEHACMHLIYARFINMFLYDIGEVDTEEPFKKIIHQGFITKDGHKMSKSRGNTVSPDEYDPDVLRLYLMFIGPYSEGGDWSDQNVVGIKRFLGRFERWLDNAKDGESNIDVDAFEDRIDGFVKVFKFNRVVSSFMELMKRNKECAISKEDKDRIIKMIGVFAPTKFRNNV